MINVTACLGSGLNSEDCLLARGQIIKHIFISGVDDGGG